LVTNCNQLKSTKDSGSGAKVIAVSLRATPCTAAVLLFGLSAFSVGYGVCLSAPRSGALVSRQAHAVNSLPNIYPNKSKTENFDRAQKKGVREHPFNDSLIQTFVFAKT
jgi:hypothetical protein